MTNSNHPTVEPNTATSALRLRGEAGASLLPTAIGAAVGTGLVGALAAYTAHAFSDPRYAPPMKVRDKVALIALGAGMGGMLGAALASPPPTKPKHPETYRMRSDALRVVRGGFDIECMNPTADAPGSIIIEGAIANTATTFSFAAPNACAPKVIRTEHRIASANGAERDDVACVAISMNESIVGNYTTRTPDRPTVERVLPASRSTCSGVLFEMVNATVLPPLNTATSSVSVTR